MKKFLFRFAALFALVSFFFAGCADVPDESKMEVIVCDSDSFDADSFIDLDQGGGAIVFQMPDSDPSLSYSISLNDENGGSKHREENLGSGQYIIFANLHFETYKITCEAITDGVVRYKGSTSVKIHAGRTVNVSLGLREAYGISLAGMSHGTVELSEDYAVAGSEIKLKFIPEEGYMLDSCSVMTADGSPVDLTGNTFVMPAGDVSVNVTFVGKIYNITLSPTITGGNVVVSETARMGTSVSLSSVPETNHELISLTVRTRSGSSVAVTGNTFVMPADDVVVNAVFWNKTDFVAVTGGNVSGDADGYGSAVFIDGRDVTIRNLWVCNHEVTQKEYLTYCRYGDSGSLSSGTGDNMPVYRVNWYDAIVYCNLRSIAEGLTPVYSVGGVTNPSAWSGVSGAGEKYCGPSGTNSVLDGVSMNQNANGYRLPTRLEWEYVARSGNTGVMETYLYSGGNNVDTVAWHSGNSGGNVHAIKTKSPNSLSIYDMSGNVWEWCWDWSEPVSATTGETGPASSSSGQRSTAGWDCKTTVYAGYTMELAIPGVSVPYERGESSSVIGFRVVRTR